MMVKYNQADLELPEQATAKDLAEKENLRDPSEALAAVINGEIKDLATPLFENDTVEILNFDDKRGKEVFWHSSAHVLAQAILRLYPDAIPTIGPPIENGFYYDFANLQISEDDFPKIEKEIKNILKQNYKPEFKLFKDKKEAMAEFGSNKFKVELIEGFEEGSPVTGYQQGEFFDLCRGPHLPALGKIKALQTPQNFRSLLARRRKKMKPSHASTEFHSQVASKCKSISPSSLKQKNGTTASSQTSSTSSPSSTKRPACPSSTHAAWSFGTPSWNIGAQSTENTTTPKSKLRKSSPKTSGKHQATGNTTAKTCIQPK